jgi:NADH-quinone oxidoreductase subunit C
MIPEALKDHETVAALEAFDSGAIIAGKPDRGEISLEIEPSRIVGVCRFLKEQRRFERLCGITAVDWYPMEPRFEAVYQLHSISRNERIRLKCKLSGKNPEVDSVTSVWAGANWYEREAFDLFGIGFRNHPNLRRIMMPENWEGYPLRKDYPVHGHRYDYKDVL